MANIRPNTKSVVSTAPTDAKVFLTGDGSTSDRLITPPDLVSTASFATSLRAAATTAAHLDSLTQILAPTETLLSDAGGTFAYGVTGGLVRTNEVPFTGNHTFTLVNTNVPQGYVQEFLRDDDGAFLLNVAAYGPTDSQTWPMGPRTSARFRFSGSHWRMLGWQPTTLNIDLQEGRLTRVLLGAYWEDEELIVSTGGAVTANFALSRVKVISLFEATTLTLSGLPPVVAPNYFAGGVVIVKADGVSSLTVAGTVKWANLVAPDLTALTLGQRALLAFAQASDDPGVVCGLAVMPFAA